MKKTEILAYTAGITDGEGHISILKKHKQNYYYLQAGVRNTNEWLCQWLKMQFGGRITTWHPNRLNWKTSYQWIIEHKSAFEFLKLVLPYLNLKKPQADLAIKYQSRRSLLKRSESNKVLDEAEIVLMTHLNKRGV